jgi:hypothetical protein
MTPTAVTSIEELLAALRARRDEIGITNESIDSIAGLPDRYASKLLSPDPSRSFGEMSLGSILGALGLGIATVVIHEDPEQTARVSHRWTQRKRPHYRLGKPRIGEALIERAKPAVLRDLSKLGNSARQAMLPAKQRSAIARKAARARWRKHRKPLGCVPVI